VTNIPFDLFVISRHIYDSDSEIGRLDETRGDSFNPWNEHDTVHFYCHVTTVRFTMAPAWNPLLGRPLDVWYCNGGMQYGKVIVNTTVYATYASFIMNFIQQCCQTNTILPQMQLWVRNRGDFDYTRFRLYLIPADVNEIDFISKCFLCGDVEVDLRTGLPLIEWGSASSIAILEQITDLDGPFRILVTPDMPNIVSGSASREF
jgi:hypothetical protein